MVIPVDKILDALTGLASLAEHFRKPAQERRLYVRAEVEERGDVHEWRVIAESVGGSGGEMSEAVAFGLAVVRRRRLRRRIVRIERYQKIPEADKTRAFVEMSHAVRAEEPKKPAERLVPFLELTGNRILFGPVLTADEQLSAARKAAQKRPRKKTRFRLLRSTVRA